MIMERDGKGSVACNCKLWMLSVGSTVVVLLLSILMMYLFPSSHPIRIPNVKARFKLYYEYDSENLFYGARLG